MARVLSTKKLKQNQRLLLLNAGISLVEYNAIKTVFIPFEAPSTIENAIFTSQNGVNSLLTNICSHTVENCFCVGEKTKALLKKNYQKVIKMTEYASELGDFIVKNNKKDYFYFFCGNIRTNEIPSKFKENNIAFKEIEVYKTALNPKKFNQEFDAILFFSPSGVKSFFVENKVEKSTAVCIGNTTASEAKKYTENIEIANSTTLESVIAKAVKTLKKNA